jgi:hypothetical protein
MCFACYGGYIGVLDFGVWSHFGNTLGVQTNKKIDYDTDISEKETKLMDFIHEISTYCGAKPNQHFNVQISNREAVEFE